MRARPKGSVSDHASNPGSSPRRCGARGGRPGYLRSSGRAMKAARSDAGRACGRFPRADRGEAATTTSGSTGSGRDELLEFANRLEAEGPAGKPLYGIPFAIKDNIDLAGHATTAACPAFAYRARESALVVQRLVAAGAIPIGKTNLDQFATGLSGTRSPYGAPSSALRAGYISGGSSSGSAVAVAAGSVSFALGTDTAGSGRVPARSTTSSASSRPAACSARAASCLPAARSTASRSSPLLQDDALTC